MTRMAAASAVRAQRSAKVAQAAANLWPGMTKDTAVQFTRIGRGLPVSKPNTFAQIHSRYYHCVDYPTGGGTQFTFFNAQQQDHITNVNAGFVPDEKPFWLTGVCITVQDLTALSSGSPSVARSGKLLDAAAITSIARAEEIRTILQAGLFKFYVGDRKILDVQDLTHFPSDGGVFIPSGGVSFASATASSFAPLTNGEPIAGNRFKLPAPYPVLPGKPISAVILFQTALSITTAARIKVELVGESIQPLNA